MKKIAKTKLSISAETIRELDDGYMKAVAGGYPSVFTCFQPCLNQNTVAPCATGPTHGLCVTYVQNGCSAACLTTLC